ncbi:hypothetical protein NQ315_015343 [Exocentrus adspersus]|uniref:Tyr recombinase domain-containing protein n=1 Tax=Exocentrus adspersus TaxID=1586481 RepID=A0AAV8V5S8_9CUCU|nr:hypothetical protein NQ315_015343 [Exocentrus adspersus]
MDIENENDFSLIPPEIREAAEVASLNLLPEKSRKVYNMTYESFLKWQKEKKTTSFSESTLLVYFTDLSTKYKSSTLWTYYSMLRSTITLKKAKTFSGEDINNFLTKASDDKYLATKVALIMGVLGACRSNELYEMKITHLQDLGSAFLVNVSKIQRQKLSENLCYG